MTPELLNALPPGMTVGADGMLVRPERSTVQPPSPPDPNLPPCEKCHWNVGNKCQHPAQGCAPCKQGMGLDFARLKPNFKCPLTNL